jgi:chorismate mutase/prephenate dehydratase
MTNLTDLREKIDIIDDTLINSFVQRQNIAEQIADAKKTENIGITDINREIEVVSNALSKVGEEHQKTTASFMRSLISLSKIRQNEELGLIKSLDFPKSSAPKTGKVVYQGIEGSWSNAAAQALYGDNELYGATFFEDVVEEIKSGNAAYGILPIENSSAGAIGLTYDLLRRNRLYIVKQIWIPVKQCLVGPKGANVNNVRTILSHPQGFTQSSKYFKGKNLELKESQNTAVAAKEVADKNDFTIAAIASEEAAKKYGLDILDENIMNDKNNRTRFISLALDPEYDENSSITSVAFTTQNRSGALSNVLQSFMLSNINLRRIESRPAATEESFRFFADLNGNILNEDFISGMKDAAMQSEFFEILGCYNDFTL